jgi:predicted esterase
MPWYQTGWVAIPVIASSAVAGVALAALRQPPPSSPPLCPPTITPDGGQLEGVSYVEARSGGAGPRDWLPMLVVLHAGGGNPRTMAEQAAGGIPVPARVIAPTGFQLVADQAGEGHWHWRDPTGKIPLSDAAAGLASFLEQIRRCRPTYGKPVVAGYDEGADLAYLLAVEEPGLVAQVIMAGGIPDVAAGAPKAPVFGLHGRKDEVASFDQAQAAYHQLVAAGAPVGFLPMFGVDHSFAGALQIKLWQESARALADQVPAPLGSPNLPG